MSDQEIRELKRKGDEGDAYAQMKYELAVARNAGMTKEDEAALVKDDGVGFLSIMHGVSKAVIRNSPDGIRAGDFLLNGRTRIAAGNAGPGFRAGVIINRPRAIYFKGESVETDSYDPKSAEWAKIAADVSKFTQGAKVGMEFLLWLPDLDALAVLPCFNKERFTSAPTLLTCRNEKRLAQVTTTITGKKNSVVLEIRPITTKETIPLPDAGRLKRAVDIFEAYKQEKAAPPATRPR